MFIAGLDISGVKTVINFVMPATVEHYIHRACIIQHLYELFGNLNVH